MASLSGALAWGMQEASVRSMNTESKNATRRKVLRGFMISLLEKLLKDKGSACQPIPSVQT
jgi:hypothetical protein